MSVRRRTSQPIGIEHFDLPASEISRVNVQIGFVVEAKRAGVEMGRADRYLLGFQQSQRIAPRTDRLRIHESPVDVFVAEQKGSQFQRIVQT